MCISVQAADVSENPKQSRGRTESIIKYGLIHAQHITLKKSHLKLQQLVSSCHLIKHLFCISKRVIVIYMHRCLKRTDGLLQGISFLSD